MVVWLLGVLPFSGALFDGLERKAYGVGVQVSSRTPLDRISSIAIDETSIQFLDRAMSRDAGRRFPTDEEFAAGLHAAFAGSIGKAATSGGSVDISL